MLSEEENEPRCELCELRQVMQVRKVFFQWMRVMTGIYIYNNLRSWAARAILHDYFFLEFNICLVFFSFGLCGCL